MGGVGFKVWVRRSWSTKIYRRGRRKRFQRGKGGVEIAVDGVGGSSEGRREGRSRSTRRLGSMILANLSPTLGRGV